MLSLHGFKQHLSSIKHETNMYKVYKSDLSLKSIENSEQVLIDNFIKQQREIERLKGQIVDIQRDNDKLETNLLEALEENKRLEKDVRDFYAGNIEKIMLGIDHDLMNDNRQLKREVEKLKGELVKRGYCIICGDSGSEVIGRAVYCSDCGKQV